MIFYDQMSEEWIDAEDDSFRVGMTPEGGKDYENTCFSSQHEFCKWYDSDINIGEIKIDIMNKEYVFLIYKEESHIYYYSPTFKDQSESLDCLMNKIKGDIFS